MTIEERINMERAIVRAAVEGLLAAGYRVGYHDGEEMAVPRSSDSLDEIMKELHSTDMAQLSVRRGDEAGSVLLVYGNDGYDVIADSSVGLEDALSTATALAEALEYKAHA